MNKFSAAEIAKRPLRLRKMKTYKAKSIAGAERRVRQLRKQVAERDALLSQYDMERRLMAMLAADTPQFSNPLVAMEAKTIRDRILEKLK